MATSEEQLLKQLAELEENEARIDEPIMTAPPGAGPEGLPPEGALDVRADIAAQELPGQRETVQTFLEEEGSPAAGRMVPERPERVNPFAPGPDEGPQRVNPFAPAQEQKQRGVDFPTPFPMERGTSRASLQLPELGSQIGTSQFFPEDYPKWAQAALTAAILTTTDPNEIAQIFTQEVEYEDPNTGEMRSTRMFPDVGIQQAPDGTLIVNNSKTGAQAIINRPGLSGFDWMQMGVIGGAYTPAGRVASLAAAPARAAAVKAATKVASETARRLAIRQARKKGSMALMAGSGVTEAGLQAGQEAAGGEFNKAEVALSTAFGIVPDYVFDPLARTMTKIPSLLAKKAADVVPENIQQAIRYAKETGRQIMTSDAVGDRITPAMNIFTKIVERIPLTGTGRARKRMGRERIDALTEIAAKYGIDVETDYGTKVMQSFVKRMMGQRFWGKQQKLYEDIPFYPPAARLKAQQRAKEMLENAWKKEADDISEGVLKEAIKKNQIDDVIVDKVMETGRPKQLTELWGKLSSSGKKAARSRFLLRGLEEASWTKTAPGVADPKKFMAFLDRPANKKVIKAWFSSEDQEVLNGAREYLRLTALAQETGKGAGMVAAVSAGAGGFSLFAGMFNALIGGTAIISGIGHSYQSAFWRNKMLKLAHTKGDEAQTAAIMRDLVPYFIAAEQQWKGNNYYFPDTNITKESLLEGGEDLMMNLEDAASSAIGDIGQVPDKLMRFFTGGEE